jgi:hypothetical protein
VGKRGVNRFRKTDLIRTLASARAGGLSPTGVEVVIAVDGSVVLRVLTERSPPPLREVMTAEEWDVETERLKKSRKRLGDPR